MNCRQQINTSNKSEMEQNAKFNALMNSEKEQAHFNTLAFQLVNGQITRKEALASFQRAELASQAAWERYMNPTPKKKTTKSKN